MYRSKPPTASFSGSERGGVFTAPGSDRAETNEKSACAQSFYGSQNEEKTAPVPSGSNAARQSFLLHDRSLGRLKTPCEGGLEGRCSSKWNPAARLARGPQWLRCFRHTQRPGGEGFSARGRWAARPAQPAAEGLKESLFGSRSRPKHGSAALQLRCPYWLTGRVPSVSRGLPASPDG